MCPSYRATRDEQHVTRGRANTLRLALSNQIEGAGNDGLASESVKQVMDLCVGCKGCKRECPTGVDMAKMKVEFLHQYKSRHGFTVRDRLVGYLPRYAPMVSTVAWLANGLELLPGVKSLRERLVGLSSKRSLPRWSGVPARVASLPRTGLPSADAREVVLFADTFNTYFENENVVAAVKVLTAGGYTVRTVEAAGQKRPLCCGRTFLATGMVDEARVEARRTIDALMPYVDRGVPIVGIEPSCLLTLRDEFQSLFPGEQTAKLAANAFLIEEFLVREKRAGRLQLPLHAIEAKHALLHGHCHQKAFGLMSDVEEVLSWIPELKANTIESSCCGMAGAFGYESEHIEVSMKMGELQLLPAVRQADAATLIVADGTSCRHQIHDGAQRESVHLARVLAAAVS